MVATNAHGRCGTNIPYLALSRSLVWNTLSDRSHDKNILKAIFRHNQSNYPHRAASQLVHQLRNIAWIPQGDNKFVRPAEALRDLLPDGFPFDPGWPWLEAIRFGEDTKKRTEQHRKMREIGKILEFSDESALADARRFAELPPRVRRPNHAAMFMHANGSRETIRDSFVALDGSELELTLADRPVTMYFTESHVADLRAAVDVESAAQPHSRSPQLSPASSLMTHTDAFRRPESVHI